jgi:heme-degrading monooxygenase HmoA
LIAILWEYSVPLEHVAEFERHYNSSGTWVIFFRKAAAYHGSALLRDDDTPGRYMTIDYWDSFDDYQDFSAENEDEYRRIDAMCELLTTSERRLGIFRIR